MSDISHLTQIQENISTLDIQTVLFLLITASFVSMITKRIKIPYTLALVLVGLLIGSLEVFPAVELTPNLVLYIFLPPLLFEGAWNINNKVLKNNILPISLFAIIGLLLSTTMIGVTLHYIMNVPWIIALLFGAMISATDPVSVLALFKKLGLNKRLVTLVEGESLFNDGTAVVVFKILLALALAGATNMGNTNNIVIAGILEFIVVVLGGAMIGLIIGWVFSTITAQYDDPPLEITLTTIVAYGSFLAAESIPVPFTPENVSLHLSGVIATVTAGIVFGNFGKKTGMSPTTRIAVDSFWEYLCFFVNSFVFLMIGLEINLFILYEHLGEIFFGILAILIARAAVIYIITNLTNLKLTEKIPLSWQHIMFWGGLRGSLSMALALSLPFELEHRQFIIIMVFGVVLFTLIVQGLSISELVKWLGLGNIRQEFLDYEKLQGHIITSDAALKELNIIYCNGEISKEVFERTKTKLENEKYQYVEGLSKLHYEYEEIIHEQQLFVERYLTEVKIDKINHLLRKGTITEDTHHELNTIFNKEYENIHSSAVGYLSEDDETNEETLEESKED